MEITITKTSSLAGYDTGGGIRRITAEIESDDNLSLRLQRQIALHEALGCCLGYTLSHEQLEELTEVLMDVLDQLEPVGGSNGGN